ncbi:tRNA synthetases class I (M)-domain-containing protein [Biscogniauxia mediterranea]|nr:tRNA synthetases class I (M)-domain-containing protein [Biscogniauxia mediterranea]
MAAQTQPVLPTPGQKSILITSALPYVNNVPHLGNIIGSVLSADVFARFCRARGLTTLFVCGSDEYGTATETKALSEGVDPATLCAKYHKIHKDIYDWFKIEFDVFGRTPTPQHTEIVQHVFTKLWENGYIEERETTQAYCPKHESFLADRFVEGECSICHFPDARGDQCDGCGNLLDPMEPDKEDTAVEDSGATGWLINPRCKLDGATPEKRTTKHLYIRLDALDEDIKSWLAKASKHWSANCIAITNSWVEKGLKPRAITRDLKWGVPIPKGLKGLSDDDYAAKVFYVWFDACIGYPSITKTYTDQADPSGKDWEKWWKNPEEVSLYQFMGKDNVPFHTIIFPGSQLGTKENWTKIFNISTTEYLNYEGGKFSKSRGVGVFGNSAKDTGISPDVWRFYLLSRRPETSDSEFKWEEFVDANNNHLLKNLGNLCQRVTKFCHAKMGGVVPEYKELAPALEQQKAEVNKLLKEYLTQLHDVKLRAALSTVLSISALGNKLLQDNGLNNQLLAENPDHCNAVINTALNLLHLLASIIFPYMPGTSQAIFNQLGVRDSVQGLHDLKFRIPDTWTGDALKPGQPIGTPELLFSNIPQAKVDEWRDAFGGEELRKQKEADAAKAAAKKAAKEKEKERKKLKKAGINPDAPKETVPQETAPKETTIPERPKQA